MRKSGRGRSNSFRNVNERNKDSAEYRKSHINILNFLNQKRSPKESVSTINERIDRKIEEGLEKFKEEIGLDE